MHVTMGLPPRHMINPRPTPFVSGKAIEYRGWPRRYDVDPSSGWREVARDEGLLIYVLTKVIIVLYIASRRVRSIVIIEEHSTQQHNTCDDGPSTSTNDQPTTNPLRVGQGN